MTCDRIHEKLDALVDGELAWWDHWVTMLHVRGCPDCARALAETRRLTEMMRRRPRRRAPSHLWGRISLAIQANVAAGDGPLKGRALRSPGARRNPWWPPTWLVPARPTVFVPLTVAASVLVLVTAARLTADDLDKTLAAMAKVRAGYAEGTMRVHRADPSEPGGGEVASIACWYNAPGKFTVVSEPLRPGGSLLRSMVVLQRGKALPEPPVRSPRAGSPLSELEPDKLLAPDLFSPWGLIRRAVLNGDTRVNSRKETSAGAERLLITVVNEENGRRRAWELAVDPHSYLVTRCMFQEESRSGGAWGPLSRIVLDRFAFNDQVPGIPRR